MRGIYQSNILFLFLSKCDLFELPWVGPKGHPSAVHLVSFLVEQVYLVRYRASAMVCF